MSDEMINKGLAKDGYTYTPDSPEVVAYKELYTEEALNDDVAVACVVMLHNQILDNTVPAVSEEKAVGLNALIEQMRGNVKTEATVAEPEVEVEAVEAETEAVEASE